MGLFSNTNRVEKQMYKELFDMPFTGYATGKNTNIPNLVFDFCSSVTHNKDIFPYGVPNQNRDKTLYSIYGLGIQTIAACWPEDEREQAISVASKGLAKSLMDSGTSRDFAVSRMMMILQINESVNKFLDEKTKEKPDTNVDFLLAACYLKEMQAEVNKKNICALDDEIWLFRDMCEEYNKAWG